MLYQIISYSIIYIYMNIHMIYIDMAMAIKALAISASYDVPLKSSIEVELSPALMCREFCAISVCELYMMFLFTLIYIYLFNNVYSNSPKD